MDGLDRYLAEISKIPVLSREEERHVALRAMGGDAEAREQLIRHNLRFAFSMAKKLKASGVGLRLEDIVQEANKGLVRAAEDFDPDKGVKFITYAVWWVKAYVQRASAYHSRPFRVSSNGDRELWQLRRAKENLQARLKRDPKTSELSEVTGFPVSKVERLQGLWAQPVRLDEPQEDGDAPLIERFIHSSALQPEEPEIDSTCIHDALDAMEDPRDATILRLYFGIGCVHGRLGLEEIGLLFDITRERVRQVKDRALMRLRDGAYGPAIQDLNEGRKAA